MHVYTYMSMHAQCVMTLPVIKLHIGVGQRVVLEPHQMQVQNGWEAYEEHALLSFLGEKKI